MDILTLLGLGFACLSAFLIYLLIQVPNFYRLKFLAIPLFLFLACAYVVEIPTVLGMPKRGYPDQQFSLVGYKMTFINQHLFIEAWVLEAGKSKLYQFPFSEELADKMRRMSQNGHPGKFVRKGGGLLNSPELQEIEIPHLPLPVKE